MLLDLLKSKVIYIYRILLEEKSIDVKFIGWNYYVQEPQTPKIVKKSYAENFVYSPKKLRMIMTK